MGDVPSTAVKFGRAYCRGSRSMSGKGVRSTRGMRIILGSMAQRHCTDQESLKPNGSGRARWVERDLDHIARVWLVGEVNLPLSHVSKPSDPAFGPVGL